jgi:diguanylate cyclase (GGDEF)-like protein/PAS domain S-box-containing protein
MTGGSSESSLRERFRTAFPLASGHTLGMITPLRQLPFREETEQQTSVRIEAYFRSFVENAQDIIAVLSSEGIVRFVSPSVKRITGYPPHELIGQDVLALIHPDDVARVREIFVRSSYSPHAESFAEYRSQHKNGSWTVLQSRVKNVLHDSDVAGMILTARDVTSERREEEAKAIFREIDQAILQAVPLDELLTMICERVTKHFDLALAWIGTKELDGSIDIRAQAGPASGYLDGLLVRWDDSPEGRGPTGIALRTGEQIVSDIDAPEYTLWRERAQSYGLHGSVSLPLASQGRVFGTLNAYPSAASDLTPEMIEKLAGFADQIAISTLQAEHQERIRLETAALEAVASAMCITDRQGKVIWINPAFTALTGYTSQEVVGHFPSVLKSGVHGRVFYRNLWETILRGETWRGEVHNRRKDGTIYIGEETITPVCDAEGRITHFIASQQDITDRKQQEEAVVHLAMHDPLTDLPNRRAMDEAIIRAIRRASRGEHSALLLIDLDNFKAINDSVGHPAGDKFLLQLGPLLSACLRPGDLLSRFGGDEFSILLDNVSPETAKSIAERLRESLSEYRFQEGGYTFAPTMSIGIALIDANDQNPASIVSLADAALHAAKETGKNRVLLYQTLTERETRITEASQWAARIKDALREGRFVLHYQPIVRLSDGVTMFHEALIRMRDGNGELIAPSSFITSAERFGLSPMVDEWVVAEAVSLLRSRPELRICTNLSGASIGDERLLQRVTSIIREAALGPGRLIFEVTESAAVQDLVHAQKWMEDLGRLGCNFALDDFGMGFSSFSYLRALPAAHVKIDGSFTRTLFSESSGRAIFEAVTSVAHALGKTVIAEWVENEATLSVLKNIGVDFGQGFYWGEAKPIVSPTQVRRKTASA